MLVSIGFSAQSFRVFHIDGQTKLLIAFLLDPDSAKNVIHWTADRTALRANLSVSSRIYIFGFAGNSLAKRQLVVLYSIMQI